MEHDVDDVELRVRVPKCVNGVKDVEGLDDEVVEGLDNSEDDRATALVDGFDEVDVTVPINQGEIVAGLLCTPNKKNDEDEYYSDELDSSDPDESGDEEGPKFERFRKEKLNKDYKFKWGMEFNSLVDLRDAICEWSVLNGREITFTKNESYRVRVECKAKCGFLVLCSKVDHKHTYAIKTLMDTHTCARV